MKKFRVIGEGVSAADVKLIEDCIKLCVRQLRKKQYEMNLPKSFLADIISQTKIVQRSKGRNNVCTAGFRAMNINLSYWQFGNRNYEEYSALDKDPVIGAAKNVTREEMMLIIIAHEISHYVQYTYSNWLPEYLKRDYQKPHGKTFQKIYRYLRRDLVNPMLRAAQQAEAA